MIIMSSELGLPQLFPAKILATFKTGRDVGRERPQSRPRGFPFGLLTLLWLFPYPPE